MQLKHFLLHRARRGTRLAPAQTSAVIRAHQHIWRQNTLHSRPVAREAATTSFQNNGRASVRWPYATDVHLMIANINEPPRGRARRWLLSHRLVDPGNQYSQDQSDDCCCLMHDCPKSRGDVVSDKHSPDPLVEDAADHPDLLDTVVVHGVHGLRTPCELDAHSASAINA